MRKGFIYLRLFICIGSEVHKKHIHAKKCLLLVFMNDMGILPFVTAYLGKLNVKGILFLRVYEHNYQTLQLMQKSHTIMPFLRHYLS